MNVDKCDYIVVGSGIAGLRASLELVKKGTVKVFCKGDPWESNTRWAQGGIAAAMQEGDTVEFHLQDTLNAGDELCYEPAVRILVEEGPQRIEELVNWGAQFDQKDGSFVFGREGAHSQNRREHLRRFEFQLRAGLSAQRHAADQQRIWRHWGARRRRGHELEFQVPHQ